MKVDLDLFVAYLFVFLGWHFAAIQLRTKQSLLRRDSWTRWVRLCLRISWI